MEVADTTNSTNVTTGALIVAGGAGIGGDLNVGGDIRPDEIFIKDNKKIYFGDDNDLQIYHASSGIGSTSFIDNTTGHLYIRNNVGSGSSNIYIQAKAGEDGIVIRSDSSVELYEDNNIRLETNSTGVTISDIVTATTFSGTNGNFTDSTIADLADIKRADIEHNSESILEHDPKFAKVFLAEKEHLMSYMFN